MLNPAIFEILYRGEIAYEQAPKISRQVSRKIGNDPELVNYAVKQMALTSKSKEEFLKIGAASNYMLVKALFATGRTPEASKLLENLISRETLYLCMSQALQEFLGKSFYDLCMSHKKLLVPSQLDAIVLDEFSEKPNETKGCFSKQGAAISLPNPVSGTDITFTYLDVHLRKLVDDKEEIETTAGLIGIHTCSFHYEPHEKNIQDVVKESFENKNVNSFSFVRANHPGMIKYVQFRFSINGFGACLHNDAGIRTPICPSIAELD